MTDDLQPLVSAYLNGDLSDEDAARLRERLASDPAALTEFVRAVDEHAELRKIFLEARGSTEALKEIRQARTFQARKVLGMIAACAAVAVAAWLGWFLMLRPKPVARLETVSGQVRRISGADTLGEMSAGQELRAGQGLETVGDSRATVVLPDGTSLGLGPRTRMPEIAPNGENRIVLAQGVLSADVAHQQPGRPLIFATFHGEAKVLGTALKLTVDPDPEKGSTRLEVTEGLVRLTRREVGDSAEVGAGHYAVVAKGKAPESKTLAAELVRQMPPNSWLSIPGTRLRQAVPSSDRGLRDPRGIVNSWSGGTLDLRRNRLVLWGGGHINYKGNEVYAFDLESLRWERLTEPTPDPAASGQVNRDGTPVARATYNGLAYLSHADRMFALGGDLAPAGGAADITWTFDFDAKSWQNRNPSGDRPAGWVGGACAYDPETRKVWWGEGRSSNNPTGGLFSYDVDANRWTRHTSESFYYQTMTVDTKRGKLVGVGDGKFFAYDIRGSGVAVREAWRSTGGEALLAKPNPGFDYDASADRLVAWAGGIVYVLNPETKSWEAFDPPGAPKPTAYGIFGRWRYVPSLKAFVVVTAIDENVHLYRPPAGT